jgi:15-cis-phytoene desaturase
MAKSVVILGGGVAGMSAAHELVERGFSVTVYERKALPGGKARSIPVPESGLPGEHGFRFFPRFYRHLPDTMKRIPYGRNANGVYDNLVQTTRAGAAGFDEPMVLMLAGFPRSLADLELIFKDAFGNRFGLEPGEGEFFAQRIWQILTSCEIRRIAEYERVGWWEFIAAEQHSDAYRRIFGAISRKLVAADARRASARTIGDIIVQMFLDMAEPGISFDRVLNGPTNDVWIDPWLAYLQQRGVQYHLNAEVESINCDGRTVQSASVRIGENVQEVTADYYLAAVPVEKMADLVNEQLLDGDPSLKTITRLRKHVQWMNGIQFYLTEETPIVNGHVLYLDAPWSLTSISQAQFWAEDYFGRDPDGRVRDCLSVDVSNWLKKGLNGKPAKNCTRQEIKDEVWQQLTKSLNVGGKVVLDPATLHSWFLDPDIQFNDAKHEVSGDREPLLVNEAGTWALRPEAFTNIPNLFLASDYIKTNTDLATMEGANEAARRAVNCIIDAAGAKAPYCGVWKLHEPLLLAPWRMHDQGRYDRGLPWNGSIF